MAKKMFVEIRVFNFNNTMSSHNHSKIAQKERTLVSFMVVPTDKCG